MYALKSNPPARSIAPDSPFSPSAAIIRGADLGTDRLALIERHLRETGFSITSFGRLIARDPRLVQDMRNGREVGADLRDRIDLYFAGYFRGVATIRAGVE